MPTARRIFPALLLTLSAGCIYASGADEPPSFPDVVYQCEDGRRFRAIMTPSRATIILTNGRRYELSGTLRRDYASFRSNQAIFYAGRWGASLRTREDYYRDCWAAEEG
jgi:hypothetical protein